MAHARSRSRAASDSTLSRTVETEKKRGEEDVPDKRSPRGSSTGQRGPAAAAQCVGGLAWCDASAEWAGAGLRPKNRRGEKKGEGRALLGSPMGSAQAGNEKGKEERAGRAETREREEKVFLFNFSNQLSNVFSN